MRHLTETLTGRWMRCLRAVTLVGALVVPSLSIVTGAQRGETTPAAPSARTLAPIDLTGYWVSVVTEDWRYRMVTPKKGDYASVPLNAAARRLADAWDPAKDEASGDACKSYGVGNIMRVPGRVHITWQDDNTLKLETDAGAQTRMLHFGEAAAAPAGDAGWQGNSVARWELAGPQRRGGGGGGGGAGVAGSDGPAGSAGPTGPAGQRGDVAGPDSASAQRQGDPGALEGRGRARGLPAARGGSLKVVTTRMKAGYLRKNGVPYSEHAVVTEYVDRHNERNGDQWFTVTTIVDDPTYLAEPFITSTHFKKEANGDKWRPSRCQPF
jgi:hypothetical protein